MRIDRGSFTIKSVSGTGRGKVTIGKTARRGSKKVGTRTGTKTPGNVKGETLTDSDKKYLKKTSGSSTIGGRWVGPWAGRGLRGAVPKDRGRGKNGGVLCPSFGWCDGKDQKKEKRP